MSAPALFVCPTADLAHGDTVLLTGAEGHHAATVRRLRAGEPIQLTDGAAWHVTGRVQQVARSELTVAVVQRRSLRPPPLRLVVVQALAKGGRDERAVEAMTEVGADVIVPWAAARSVARGGAERWPAVVREAAKQARRPLFPVVEPLADTDRVAALLRGAALGAVLDGAADRPLAGAPVPARGDVVVVVGPEGGVSEAELAAFAAAGAGAYRLGPTVLRSSTAGVVALAVLAASSGRWGGDRP